MIQDKNRIFDGWLSLEGGVDAGRASDSLAANQAESAINMTFRGGDAATRPGFRKLTESFPSFSSQLFCYRENHFDHGRDHIIGEYQEPGTAVTDPPPTWFEDENSEFIYRNGKFQTALAYSPHNGEDCIMALIGGRLFKIVPGVSTARVIEVLVTDDERNLRNMKESPIAYMVQADKWLIAQDGISNAIIYDATTARRAVTSGDRDSTEVPVGTIMAYGMGRIVVIVNKRDVAFGDLYGSHDLPDPADSLILFTERNFLSEGFDAAIPFQQGVATGAVFFPQLDTSTGNGQLMVFAERGAASFFLSLPRELWKTSQFQILSLLTTGLRGHRSIAVVNEDLWFRSDDGARSYRQARSEQGGWAHIPLSTNVRQYFANDSNRLLRYASAIYFDNRIIFTTSPMWYQGRPNHWGMVAVDFDILSSFGSAIKPAWEGQWFMPAFPIQLLTGTFGGVTRAFVFAIDATNQNQLYELSVDDNDDWDGQCINWQLISRSFDFQKMSQESTPFTENEIYDADIWLKEIIRCGGSIPQEPPTPPVVATGACCIGGECSIETEADCISAGGTYQGDDTTCDPNPCEEPPPTPTGACCRGEDCTIETQESCESDGGVYQGDDATCIPNPCEEPPPTPCPESGCAFLNPCDGLYYTTRITTSSGSAHLQGAGTFNDWVFECVKTETCSSEGIACEVTGSGSLSADGGEPFAFYTPTCGAGESGFFTDLSGVEWEPGGGTEPESACEPPQTTCNTRFYDNLVCGTVPTQFTYNGLAEITYTGRCAPPLPRTVHRIPRECLDAKGNLIPGSPCDKKMRKMKQ